jgi:hypothetical protein
MVGTVIVAAAGILAAGLFFGLAALVRRPGARRPRSTSAATGLLGTVEEVFHPSAVVEVQALDEQQRWVEPAPTPDKR